MKTIRYSLLAAACTFLSAGYVLAQENYSNKSTTTTTTSKSGIAMPEVSSNWYESPWAWVAGAVLVLLILVLLFSGGRRRNSDSTTVYRTTITRRDEKLSDG